ncbi:hypothetical protein J8340_22635 [Escherichia coli]|nr:hypothetical protein [Escherichia coli]
MKKRLSITLSLILSLVLVLSSSVSASGNLPKNSVLSNDDIQRLVSFGFNDQEIETMTEEEYNNFNIKYGTDTMGTLVATETKYYRVSNEDGITEISKVKAEKEVESFKEEMKNLEKSGISPFATNTRTTSWMKMTTTSSLVSGTTSEYVLKNSFEWLINPLYKLTDVIGITFNPNLTYIQDSEYAVYTREINGFNPVYPSETEYMWSAEHKSQNAGIAFNIDLKAYSDDGKRTVKKHSGYMVFRAEKNNTYAISTNAYGHYSHLYNTINFDVSFPAGMAISGATQHDDMPDTAISWNF